MEDSNIALTCLALIRIQGSWKDVQIVSGDDLSNLSEMIHAKLISHLSHLQSRISIGILPVNRKQALI